MEKLFKRKSILITLIVAFTLLAGVFFNYSIAKAESYDSVATKNVLPESMMENYALSSPIDAIFWENSTAIVHTNELLIFSDGEYKAPISLVSPQQVRKLNDEYLIVSQDGSLYSVKISDLSVNQLLHSTSVTVGCNYFDCNDKFIVTAYSKDIKIYPHSDLSISAPTSFEYQIDLSSPISINDKGEIFYVHGDKLYKCTTADRSETLISDDDPSAIIANDNFVYMISGGKVVRIDTDGSNRIEFNVSDQYKDYDLGNLSTPVSLSFKGDNLLIADSSKNAVQEFALNEKDNLLEFTGFAVAKEKTAYNRIGGSAKDVEICGDTIAVLDQFKLTVITLTENGKLYKNFLQSDLGNVKNIAITGNTIACLDDTNKVKYLDLTSGDLSSSNDVDGTICDVAARNGKFYLAVIKNADVLVLQSNDLSFDVIHTFTNAYDVVYNPDKKPIITTDKNGTIYASHPVADKIYSLTRNGDEYIEKQVLGLTATGVSKIQTDLSGNVFCLSDSKIIFTDGTNAFTVSLTNDNTNLTDVKSFAIGENTDDVYIVKSGFEGLLSTDLLPNFSAEDLITSSYVTSGETADISGYKTFVSGAEWILSVNPTAIENGHTFNIVASHPTKNQEFLAICTLTVNQTFGSFTKSIEYTVLAGHTSSSVNATFISESTLLAETTAIVAANQAEAFVITDVNMYYFPIISKNDAYCLSNGNEFVRLTKGTKISPVYKLEFLDKEFFYATLTIDGQTKSGFVPVNFTIEVLDKDVVTKTYTLEKVKAVTVKDEFGNSKINLEKGTEVRLYSVNDGVALIEYLDQGIWKHGYVDNSSIIKAGNTTIRNAVIIILMSASVLATSIYFVIRKKRS